MEKYVHRSSNRVGTCNTIHTLVVGVCGSEIPHLGIDSSYAGWDVGGAFTHSQNKQTDRAVAGYMSGDKFEELVRTGAYNPFVSTTGAAALLAPAVLRQELGEYLLAGIGRFLESFPPDKP